MGEKILALALVSVMLIAGVMVLVPVEKEHAVTFDINDGSGDSIVIRSADGMVTVPDSKQFSANEKKESILFWVSIPAEYDSNNNVVIYKSTEKFSADKDKVLHAVWGVPQLFVNSGKPVADLFSDFKNGYKAGDGNVWSSSEENNYSGTMTFTAENGLKTIVKLRFFLQSYNAMAYYMDKSNHSTMDTYDGISNHLAKESVESGKFYHKYVGMYSGYVVIVEYFNFEKDGWFDGTIDAINNTVINS